MTFDLDDLPNADDVQHALRLIGEIEMLAEDVPERGEEYALSVLDTAADIGRYIDDFERIPLTEK